MHFDPSVKSLYSSVKVSLFGLDTASNTTHHPKAEAKTVEFAHLSLCHVLLPFVDSVSLLHKKKSVSAWRRGVRPKSWLLICLCGRHWDLFWDRNCPEIYEHKVSAFRHRNAIHSDASKDSSSDLCVYACPCTWYSTRKCTCQTT